jgi:hypothetical protein
MLSPEPVSIWYVAKIVIGITANVVAIGRIGGAGGAFVMLLGSFIKAKLSTIGLAHLAGNSM